MTLRITVFDHEGNIVAQTRPPTPPEDEASKRPMGPEPIRPIVRRVIVAMPGEQGGACAECVLAYLEDPYVNSLYGEPVEP